MARKRTLGITAALALTLGMAVGAVPMEAAAGAPVPVTVRVSPQAGGPGTRVTLTGTATEGSGRGSSFGNVCWGGCANGFTESLNVTWPSPDHFRATFVVPTTAYLTNDGPHALRDGRYRVSVNCIGLVAPGCDFTTQATATFRVTGPTPSACQVGEPCAQIHLSTTTAQPGELIRVSGWAPLTEIIGTPFGYTLALSQGDWNGPTDLMGSVSQSMTGAISGTLRVPPVAANIGLVQPGRYTLSLESTAIDATGPRTLARPGVRIQPTPSPTGEDIYLAPVAVHIKAPMPWSSLPLGRLSLLQPSLPTDIASRVGHPDEIAYCAPGAIRLSTDGGRHWQSVSTRAVARVSKRTAFPLVATMQATTSPPAACSAVVLDPGHRHTLYATFPAYDRAYRSAPPVFTVLYVTTDAGAHWRPVPPPHGRNLGDYAGIVADASGVTAVYDALSGPGWVSYAPPLAAERTTDGGAAWQPAALTCPPTGACVRFGPAPGEYPGMGASALQPLERSTNAGRTWSALSWPQGNVIAQGSSGLSQLVSYGASDVLLVDGESPDSLYPAVWSEDGGRTWRAIGLPTLPGTTVSTLEEGIEPFTDLTMLPDGSLIASNGIYPRATWYRLPPGARHWQVVPGLAAEPANGGLTVAGARLWWVSTGPGGRPAAASAPLP